MAHLAPMQHVNGMRVIAAMTDERAAISAIRRLGTRHN
jgi:hypothetical protein